jgi:hypothetical protein
MSIRTHSNVVQARRLLLVGVIAILGIGVTAGFYWMQTNHVIAPPIMRFLNGAWRVFIYQCLGQSTPQVFCLRGLPLL